MEETDRVTSRESPYTPIDSGQGEIRLLEIEPGEYNDEIRINLKWAKLSQNPTYTALSYVWGHVQSLRLCLLNGIHMSITENLDCALRHFRNRTATSLLWADALCINQADLDERAAQIRLMKELFERAQSIFAWLGQPSDNEKTELAVALLNRIEENYADNTDAADDTSQTGYGEHNMLLPGSVDSDTWQAWDGIAELFTSEYFTRLWIIQEATTPTQIRFWSGEHSFGKDALQQAVAIVDAHSINSVFPSKVTKACNAISSVGQVTESRRERENGRFDTLLRLLQDFRGSKCADPLDRVFAALGLAKDHSAADIIVDYRTNVTELYSRVARTLIMDPDVSLTVLGAVVLPTDDSTHLEPPMPSWVPDWRQACMIPEISLSVNSRDLNDFLYSPYPGPVSASFNGTQLSVKGIVEHEVDIRTMTEPWDEEFESWRTIMSWYEQLKGQSDASSGLATAICRSFVGDRSLNKYDEDEDLFHIQRGGILDLESAKRDTRFLGLETLQLLLVTHLILASICYTRRMAILSNSRVAVLPAAARIGDKIAAFRGGHALYLLRPLTTGQNEYSFIGECYVDGWMDGEIVKEAGEERLESITMV